MIVTLVGGPSDPSSCQAASSGDIFDETCKRSLVSRDTHRGIFKFKMWREMSPGQQVPAPSLGSLHRWLRSLLRLLHSHNIEPQLLQSPEILVHWHFWRLGTKGWFSPVLPHIVQLQIAGPWPQRVQQGTYLIWSQVPDLDSDKRLLDNDASQVSLLVEVPISLWCFHKLPCFWKLQTGLVGQLRSSKAGWQLNEQQCAEAEKMAEEVAWPNWVFQLSRFCSWNETSNQSQW